jgi:hypothetical protein
MEDHPESSIFSKNQQLESFRVEAPVWTPIHTVEDRLIMTQR